MIKIRVLRNLFVDFSEFPVSIQILLENLTNENSTRVEKISSSGDFPLAEVGCSREVELIVRFGMTDLKSIHAFTYCSTVCAVPISRDDLELRKVR